jgi:hypothetical protein
MYGEAGPAGTYLQNMIVFIQLQFLTDPVQLGYAGLFHAHVNVGLGIGLNSNSLKVTEDTSEHKFVYNNRISGILVYAAAYF